MDHDIKAQRANKCSQTQGVKYFWKVVMLIYKNASILFMLSYIFNTNIRLNIIKPSYQESWSPAYSQQWKQPHKKGLALK